MKEQIQYYLRLYKDTYRKESAFFEIPYFNSFLIDEFPQIEQSVRLAEYQKEDRYKRAFDEIKKIINNIL